MSLTHRVNAAVEANPDYIDAVNGDAAAASRLPMSDWGEARRAHMTPQTIAANYRLYIAEQIEEEYYA